VVVPLDPAPATNTEKTKRIEQKVAKDSKGQNLSELRFGSKFVIWSPTERGQLKKGNPRSQKNSPKWTSRTPNPLPSLSPLLPSVQILFCTFCVVVPLELAPTANTEKTKRIELKVAKDSKGQNLIELMFGSKFVIWSPTERGQLKKGNPRSQKNSPK